MQVKSQFNFILVSAVALSLSYPSLAFSNRLSSADAFYPVLLAEARAISKEQAKRKALASAGNSAGARVVSVKLIKGGEPHYKVRLILKNGRVKNVRVDAKSGAVW